MSRVLVSCLDPIFRDEFSSDSQAYLRHYRRVDVVPFSSIRDFLDALKMRYDIVHLFGLVTSGGELADATGCKLLGSDLVNECYERNVKLLWIANGNRSEDYIKGFKRANGKLNLIMTLNRNGANFGHFLDKLLARLVLGETLPLASVTPVPQADGPWHQDLPSCIFAAVRGTVKPHPGSTIQDRKS